MQAKSEDLVDPPFPSRIKPGVTSMEFLSAVLKKIWAFGWLFFSKYAKSEYLVDFPTLQVLPFFRSTFSHLKSFWGFLGFFFQH